MQRLLAVATALAACVSVVSRTPTATAACGSWERVTGARVTGVLSDVSAESATDVWAVGSSRSHTLAEHWNGSTWRRVTTPNPAPRSDALDAVVAVTPTDAWAAGRDGVGGNGRLLLHWDGSVWRRTPLPRGASHATIRDLAALSPSDVWAVGASSHGATRTLHYDGSSWKLIPSPTPAATTSSVLAAVAASTSADAWAVGDDTSVRPLVDHWDGSMWTESAIPSEYPSGLTSVTHVPGTGDYWAVGDTDHRNFPFGSFHKPRIEFRC